MAKSKVGGTRAYIRGRIGSDVYSVGKDAKGSRQQVVRSLAEQVSNPRTQSQMIGRMIMSTVMQAVSGLTAIIDHSFDGLPKGQPSISEFIRRNYALVKADATDHPTTGNKFGLSKFQEKGAKVGAYNIANGDLILSSGITVGATDVQVVPNGGTQTVGALRETFGVGADGYLTVVKIGDTTGVSFIRLQIDPSLSDDTALTDELLTTMFIKEGQGQFTIEDQGGIIAITGPSGDTKSAYGVIMSDKVNGAWKHNNSVMVASASPEFTSDNALPTYPLGSENFLNGGDL